MKWEKVAIKDICTGIYDGPHATPPLSDTGAIFLGISNFNNGRLDFSDIRYISEDDLPKWTKRVIPQKNDIVFSYEATLNLYAIIPEGFRGCLGRRMALLRVDETKADYKFLYYYFYSDAWRATVNENIVLGATVDRIPLIKFPDFPVELPPLETQHRIADILSVYDDLIENNQKQIKLLEEATQRLYKEWFVDLRFPGHENTKIVDGVPEGWSRTNINEILTFHRGYDLTKNEMKAGRYPVVGSTTVIGYHNEFKIKGPGIVTGRSGSLGKYQFIWDNFWPHNTSLYISDYKDHNIFFVYSLLQTVDFASLNNGGAIPTLNRNVLSNIEVIEPTDELQEMFAKIAEAQYRKIRDLEKQNNQLKMARDVLLPKLMSGEVEV